MINMLKSNAVVKIINATNFFLSYKEDTKNKIRIKATWLYNQIIRVNENDVYLN
jgi:hypothetical protein